jgi:hypothetical protein
VTNFVFGILVGLFIVAALVVAFLVSLDWLSRESGVLIPPLEQELASRTPWS